MGCRDLLLNDGALSIQSSPDLLRKIGAAPASIQNSDSQKGWLEANQTRSYVL